MSSKHARWSDLQPSSQGGYRFPIPFTTVTVDGGARITDSQYAESVKLHTNELEAIRQLFSLCSASPDGNVTQSELQDVLSLLGWRCGTNHIPAPLGGKGHVLTGCSDFLKLVGEQRHCNTQCKQALAQAFEAFADPCMPAGCIKVKTLQDIMVKHSRNCEDHYAADLDDFLSSFCMGTSGNVNFQEMLAQCGSRMVL